MKLGPHRPKLSLRINGTRVGDAARPEAAPAPAPARTLRRPMPALVIRDYRDDIPDDTGAAS